MNINCGKCSQGFGVPVGLGPGAHVACPNCKATNAVPTQQQDAPPAYTAGAKGGMGQGSPIPGQVIQGQPVQQQQQIQQQPMQYRQQQPMFVPQSYGAQVIMVGGGALNWVHCQHTFIESGNPSSRKFVVGTTPKSLSLVFLLFLSSLSGCLVNLHIHRFLLRVVHLYAKEVQLF